MISTLIDYFARPVKFDLLNSYLRVPGIKILDVGCGNHSATRTKKYYPDSKYYGLDKARNYNNNKTDFKLMEKFYQLDLDTNYGALALVPSGYFDVVILSHVLEHLINGETALSHLIKKVKSGGILYLETPSPISLFLPHMRGTLNFYDDPTHTRPYLTKDLVRLLKKHGFRILKSGLRRSKKKILLWPVYLLVSLFVNGYVSGHIFWDLFGFSTVIIGQKK